MRPPKTDYAPIVSRHQRLWPYYLLAVVAPCVVLIAVGLILRWAGGLG